MNELFIFVFIFNREVLTLSKEYSSTVVLNVRSSKILDFGNGFLLQVMKIDESFRLQIDQIPKLLPRKPTGNRNDERYRESLQVIRVLLYYSVDHIQFTSEFLKRRGLKCSCSVGGYLLTTVWYPGGDVRLLIHHLYSVVCVNTSFFSFFFHLTDSPFIGIIEYIHIVINLPVRFFKGSDILHNLMCFIINILRLL